MRHAEQIVFKTVSATPKEFDFNGCWRNELGSTMELNVEGGNLTGSYTSNVSNDGGPTDPFPLTGTVSGDLFSFTVNWGPEITTWIGHHVEQDGSAKLLTLWHLVQAVADETDPQKQWKMILSGADEFYRQISDPV